MSTKFEISDDFIAEQNKKSEEFLAEDFDYLATKLKRTNIEIENIVEKAQKFQVAVPSWGVGTGGTRFARFPGPGEPRHVFDKLQDCGVLHQLARATPTVSLHIPWDKCTDWRELRGAATALGLAFDAMNSNTFSDQKDQA